MNHLRRPTRFLCAITLVLITRSRLCLADGAAPSSEPAKRGAFDCTFTDRSPLSEYDKLLARLNVKADTAGPDYDLSKEHFAVYVPPDDGKGTPMGILVETVPDGVPQVYPPLKETLDRRHLIMIGIVRNRPPMGTTAGLCLDAVYNLEKQYPIDTSRVYLMGAGDWMEPIGWSTGDVFTGDVYIWWLGYFRRIGTAEPLFSVTPPPALLAVAKTRPQVLAFGSEPGHDAQKKLLMNIMTSDGFAHVYDATVSHEDFLKPTWVNSCLDKIESTKPIIAVKPASRPMASPAASLLAIAKTYISSGQPDRGAAKLKQLIDEYPASPEAAQAKTMLANIEKAK